MQPWETSFSIVRPSGRLIGPPQKTTPLAGWEPARGGAAFQLAQPFRASLFCPGAGAGLKPQAVLAGSGDASMMRDAVEQFGRHFGLP